MCCSHLKPLYRAEEICRGPSSPQAGCEKTIAITLTLSQTSWTKALRLGAGNSSTRMKLPIQECSCQDASKCLSNRHQWILTSYLVSLSPLLEDVLERDSWEDSGSVGTCMQLTSSNWICAAGEHRLSAQDILHRSDLNKTAVACIDDSPYFHRQCCMLHSHWVTYAKGANATSVRMLGLLLS